MSKPRKSQSAPSATQQELQPLPPPAAEAAAEVVHAVRAEIAPADEVDFVSAMFDMLEKIHPAVQAERLEMERAVRVHFRGQRYVGSRPDPGTTAARALVLFNGTNARTVARTLGISRQRVYQILKQPGGRG